MIGEYTMNEYKAYKNLVKHKKRINRVFSEVCGDMSFCSRRPGRKLKCLLLLLQAVQLDLRKLQEEDPLRAAFRLSARLRLLVFNLRRQNLSNRRNASASLPNKFRTPFSRWPLVSLR
jgi:hypothetical protein